MPPVDKSLTGHASVPEAIKEQRGMAKFSVEAAEVAEVEDRRRSDRTDLIVRVDYATVDELFSEFTRDINEGGLFIETEKPRPAGTEVALHFHLPGSDQLMKTTGIVVRVCDGSGGTVPGMGIEFEDLSEKARAYINQLIRALRARSGPTPVS
jgi:uncharacterized protein (TIGR02266 family)